MVTLAFGGIAAASGAALSSGAAIVGGLLASYIDQRFVYPELFGKNGNPKPDSLEGFQLSTTDPGAPRWDIFGSRAWVPCHYMWTKGIREELQGNGQTGKGGRPFVQSIRADVGLAYANGPIARPEVLSADERAFYVQSYNRALVEDTRWSIEAGSGASAGRLVITATDATVADFTGLFFASGSADGYQVNNPGGYSAGVSEIAIDTGSGTFRRGDRVFIGSHAEGYLVAEDAPDGATTLKFTPALQTSVADNVVIDLQPATDMLVRLESVSPSTLIGYYRVALVSPHTGESLSSIELVPLEGQTPATGVAGSPFEFAKIRRIDSGAASSAWNFLNGSSSLALIRLDGEQTIPGIPNEDEDDLRDIWVPNGIYRFSQFEPSGPPPASANGLYRLLLRTEEPGSFGVPDGYRLTFEPLEGQSAVTSVGSASLPAIIVREKGTGFVFDDPQQSATEYAGFPDQLQDPTLASHVPDASAHRGIAHVSISDWNLGAHNNTFPRVTALLRARSGETVSQAIDRICAQVMPQGTFSSTDLRVRALLGYSMPGGMARGQALQPLLTFFGIAVQDRGGVLTFLDERDLPVVPVATRHLNARPLGSPPQQIGFVADRAERTDLPQRVLVSFVDPSNDGAQGQEGDGVRAPGSLDRGTRDTIEVNVRPLVVWPHEAKRRARELRRRMFIESTKGSVSLPPNYMDVMPGTCLTFRANNRHEESLPAGTSISVTAEIRDILPNTVQLEVLFESSGRARLTDDGSGAFEGLPAGVAATVNSINYATGVIALTFDEDLDGDDEPVLRYQYDLQWLVRVTKARQRAYDFGMDCEVVETTTDDPLPPVPRAIPTGAGAPVTSELPDYLTHVLDIPPLGPGAVRALRIGFVAATSSPSSGWRGATVYESPSGVDRWTAVGIIEMQTTMGVTVGDALPDDWPLGVVDWENELTVDLPNGEDLTNATLQEIGYGINWAIYGDEIIAFHEVEAGTGTEWTLRGIVRGMRQTIEATRTHTGDGERFMLITGLGGLHGLQYEPIGGLGQVNATRHFRIVPGGAGIDDADTVSVLIEGNSTRPAPPIFEADDLDDSSGPLVARWWRRSLDEVTLFGPSVMPAGEVEQYRVVAIDHTQFTTLSETLTDEAQVIAASTRRTWMVNGAETGAVSPERTVTYTDAEITTDLAVAGGTTVGLLVYQVGSGGYSRRSEIQTYTP